MTDQLGRPIQEPNSMQSFKGNSTGLIVKTNGISSFDYDKEDVYDWIIDIDLITNINKTGWKIFFSDQF